MSKNMFLYQIDNSIINNFYPQLRGFVKEIKAKTTNNC